MWESISHHIKLIIITTLGRRHTPHTHTHTDTHTHTHTYIHTHTHTQHTNTRTNKHTNTTHIRTHTCIPKSNFKKPGSHQRKAGVPSLKIVP